MYLFHRFASLRKQLVIRSESVLVAHLFVTAALVSVCAVGLGLPEPERTQAPQPLSEILRSDGTIKTGPGITGSYDVSGYTMTDGPRGEPRFAPAAPSASSLTPLGPENDGYNQWSLLFSRSRTDRYDVTSMATDPNGNMYVGGAFNSVGGVFTPNLAKWNGSSWSAIRVSSGVQKVLTSGTEVYAGGDFTSIEGVVVKGLGKWDGTTWTALGDGLFNSNGSVLVNDMTFIGTDLYVAGRFTHAGAVEANNIAMWDGSEWSALGEGTDFYIRALTTDGSNLFAAGYFNMAGGVPAKGIAKWDGTTWSAMGEGISGIVQEMLVHEHNLYIAGNVTTAGLVAVNSIARWDGSKWSALELVGGEYPRGYVTSLAIYNGRLVAGYYRTGTRSSVVSEWNGTTWTAVGSPMSGNVFDLFVLGDRLIAGGRMSHGNETDNLMVWNGSYWRPHGNGIFGTVRALTIDGSDVYVGGDFLNAGEVDARNVAKWNGRSWSALGSGLDDVCYTLALKGGDLYAGGDFTTAGGLAAEHVARWNGATWSSLGSGLNETVRALATSDNALYAGGDFTLSGGINAQHVAKWDGMNWMALGTGTNGSVLALATMGQNLFAGGEFTLASGISTPHVAKWNGTGWSPVGSGTNGSVFCLSTDESNLYAGGAFTAAGGASAMNIAVWNGNEWTNLKGGADGSVYTISTFKNRIFAAGDFTKCDGINAYKIGHWDGTFWRNLGFGLADTVFASGISNNTLFAGGLFRAAYLQNFDGLAAWSPWVEFTQTSVTESPEPMAIGANPYGLLQPVILVGSGTIVSFTGGLPTTITLNRRPVYGSGDSRLSLGAFTVSPAGVRFDGDGAVLRAEFMITDASPDVCRLVSFQNIDDESLNLSKVEKTVLPEQTSARWVRSDLDYRSVYEITAPITETAEAYAVMVESYITQPRGLVMAGIEPEAVRDQGAMWRVDTDTWAVPNDARSVTSGTHTIEFSQVAGWNTPPTQTFYVPATESVYVTGTYSRIVHFAEVELSMEASPVQVVVGGLLTYKARIFNTGSASAENVTFKDVLPAGMEFIGASATAGTVSNLGGTISGSWTSLAAGGEIVITIQVRPAHACEFVNTATIAADNDSQAANNSVSVSISAVNPPPESANLALSLSAVPENPTVGKNIQFLATLTNNGPAQATGLNVKLAVAPNAVFVSSSSTHGQATYTAEGLLLTTIDALEPGDSAVIGFTVMKNDPGPLVCTAEATGVQLDSDLSDNASRIEVQVAPTVEPREGPDLVASVSASTRCIQARSRSICLLKTKVTVQNQGTQAAGRSSAQLFISTDAQLDSSDRLLRTIPFRKASPGQSQFRGMTLHLPGRLNPTGMYLIAVSDASNGITESNENNNIGVLRLLP